MIESMDDSTPILTDVMVVYGSQALQPYSVLNAFDIDDRYEAFEVFRKRMFSVYPEDKILKEIVREGVGELIKDAASFHYVLYVEGSEYPFDVSYLRCAQPLYVRIGANELIPGLHMALKTMKTGEMSYFLIHPSLAFSDTGCPPIIPINATILARIEAFDIADHPDDAYYNAKIPALEKAIKLAEDCCAHANDCFGRNDISAAISKYRKGVQILVNARLVSDEDDILITEELKELLCKLYINLAVCYGKFNNYDKVCKAADDAFRNCPERAADSAKLLFHNAKALRKLGNYQLAKKRVEEAAILNPRNGHIKDEIKKLNKEIIAYKDYEKRMCTTMFGVPENSDDNTPVAVVCNNWEQKLKDFINSDEQSVTITAENYEEITAICNMCSQLHLISIVDPAFKTVVINKGGQE